MERIDIFTYEYYDDGPNAGYLKHVVLGAGVEDQSQEYGYDKYGNLNTVTDSQESITSCEYNAMGQMIVLHKPFVEGSKNSDIFYHYGRDGRLAKEDMPRGNYQDSVINESYIRHQFDYDVLGHLISVIYGSNTAFAKHWHIKRTAEGFPSEITDPVGRITRLSYDERNRLLSQTLFAESSEQRTKRFLYDVNGNLSLVIDPTGRNLDYHYDSWDRPLRVELPGTEGSRTSIHYLYGIENHVEHIEVVGLSESGLSTVIEEQDQVFDERGRLVSRTQESIGSIFWYDRDSALTRIVDQRGNAVSMHCDSIGRIRSITDPLGNQTKYTFNTKGLLKAVDNVEVVPDSATNEMYHTEFEYDPRNRLTKLTDPLGNTIIPEYDDRDLLVGVTSPLKTRTEYEYDVDGLVVLLRNLRTAPLLPVEHRWQRNLAGRVITYTAPLGASTHYEYNSDSSWTKIIMPDGSVRKRFFDSAGQLIREIAPSGKITEYDYDKEGLIERLRFLPAPEDIRIEGLSLHSRWFRATHPNKPR